MNRMRRGITQVLTWGIGILFAFAFGQAAAVQISGAIQTTDSTGTVVNGNIYANKADVYLTGGPQNTNSKGLPDGNYFFQVTDPSTAVLLSLDPAVCRQVQVTGGNIVGVVPAAGCEHSLGTFNVANGEQPVQLCNHSNCANDYADTTNNGGEYKVTLISTDDSLSCGPSIVYVDTSQPAVIHFPDSCTKTDNFKVKKAGAAYVTVCKFEDLVGDGIRLPSDPLIPGWPISATGVDSGNQVDQSVNTQTGPDGCVSFAFTDFTLGIANESVTFTEGTLGADWMQTFPSPAGTGWTLTLAPNTTQTVYFGNFNINCVPVEQCSENGGLTATKDAAAGNKFTWEIAKSVDKTEIDTSAGAALFNYTVTVTHDTGTGWKVAGSITLSNNSFVDITAAVTDTIDNGGTCDVTGQQVTVGAGELVTVPYSCTFGSNPGSGTNTATVTGSTDFNGNPVSDPVPATAPYNFAGNIVGGSVIVSDPLDTTSPHTYSYTDPSPSSFTYSHTFTGDPAGTCTKHDNTAAFTSGATGSASQTVTVCVGADLTVSKTASLAFKRTYNWNITKAVDKTLIEQLNGTATFNYTVVASETGFTDSDWQVTGTITVSNPNNWEAITFNLSDAIDNGGTCTIAGGGTGLSVAATSTVTKNYTCTYSSAPNPANFTNTGKATWDSALYSTPTGSASGSATGAFGDPTTRVNQTITVTDTFNGTTTTLGTLTATDAAPFTSATYKYSHAIPVVADKCVKYDNTAKIVETGQSAGQTVTVCGPVAGALTMGFWQNKNGQGIITGGASTSGVCNSGTWLRQYAPFQDLSTTATCAQVGTYVTNVIKAANASGSSMNAMLKAQMLATALDVYFGGGPGGNPINAPAPIGGLKIDLTKICKMIDGSGGTAICSGVYANAGPAFGGATSMLVSDMLTYAASQSNAGGSTWYGNVKATQQLAKDAFDAINNDVAFIAP